MATITGPLLIEKPVLTQTPATIINRTGILNRFTPAQYLPIIQNLSFTVDNSNTINILTNASTAAWTSAQVLSNGSLTNVTKLPWMGSENSNTGFVINSTAIMEDKVSYNALRTHPMWCNYGMIKGVMPITISGNGIFKAKVGFLNGAVNSDGVTFLVNVYFNMNGIQTCKNVLTQAKRYSGALQDVSADLSQWNNQAIQLELRVDAGPSSGQDWAAWINPVIEIQQPVSNLLYKKITDKFSTTDLSLFGILNVYQKTSVTNTFLIVPVSYSITLDETGRPFANLQEIVIADDTNVDKSNASLCLGLAPKISDFQLVNFKTALKKSLNITTPISFEYPVGNNVKLTSQDQNNVFTAIESISLNYVGQNNISGNHFLLTFAQLGLTDVAGFIALLKNNYAIPVSLTVNTDNDESSTLDLSFEGSNIIGKAITANAGSLLPVITVTNNTNNVIHIKSLAIEDDLNQHDLSILDITLSKQGDSFPLPYLNFPSNKDFAFSYIVDFDESKILQVDITDNDSNQMYLTATCPVPNNLTLAGSADFFDQYQINEITVTFSDPVKHIVPSQIVLSKNTSRYELVFILIPAGGDFTNKIISYQATVSFTNTQPPMIQSVQQFDLSKNDILELDSNALNLGQSTAPSS